MSTQPDGGTTGTGGFGLLSDFAIFSGLDVTSLAEMTAAARQRTWPAGALIFAQWDEGDHMLAIRSGRIRLSLSSARGREIVLQTLGPGDILGEMALLDGAPRSADATAVQDTVCFVLPRRSFEAVASRRPDVGLALARHLCTHLRHTNFQMESIALYDLQTRVVRFLLYLIGQSRQSGGQAEARLLLEMNQSDISAILGATRPKVNLAFQALLASGALRREGETLICNIATLERMAEGHSH